jgi:hypothetical protein
MAEMNRVFTKLTGDQHAGTFAEFWERCDKANGEDRKRLESDFRSEHGKPFWEDYCEWRKENRPD